MEGSERRLVVDAMNVIGSRPTGWWRDRDQAVRDLAARLQRYVEVSPAAVTLVVDGFPIADLPEGGDGPVRIVYAHSRARDAADDRIVALLDGPGGPGGPTTVVTADRELRERAARRGARHLGPRALLDDIDHRLGVGGAPTDV